MSINIIKNINDVFEGKCDDCGGDVRVEIEVVNDITLATGIIKLCRMCAAELKAAL
jgi:hypothetical protein